MGWWSRWPVPGHLVTVCLPHAPYTHRPVPLLQAPVAPYIDHVLAPLARRGFFGSVLCGVEATKHLVYHPLADCVCMTGGTATHDAIVWGPREEQEGRKARNDPLLKVGWCCVAGVHRLLQEHGDAGGEGSREWHPFEVSDV